MSYIGVPPQATFSSGLLDRFTSTTGTTVTLTHDISSENDIVVFVNFVKQDSTTYSVGGTGNKTLTLGGTLVSSDIVEVHYLNIVGQTNAPAAGSVTTATINDTAVTGAKLNTDVISAQTELASGVASTDELLISDAGVLKRVDVSLVGGTNTPSFSAYMGSAQTVSSGTHTKLQFQTESYDTDGTFDHSTNYRWTPGAVGKFLVTAYARIQASTDEVWIQLRKNGSTFMTMADTRPNAEWLTGGARVLNHTNSSDYYEIWAYQSSGGNITSGSGIENSEFSAFKLIT